jgi:polysaccharide biosynthesis protein PslH
LKPSLLFLCHTLPFPPDGGVHLRTYNVLRLLSREFDVTALCFYRRAERASPSEVRDSVAELSRLATVEAFPIPQEYSRARLLKDHLLSVLTHRAYTVSAYESTAFRNRLRELLSRGSFRLIHMDSLDLAGYLPLLVPRPILCVHHNVESELLRRRARYGSPISGPYLRLQSWLTRSEERRWCPAVSVNITVSNEDARTLRKIAPRARYAVVPNGVDTQYFRPAEVQQEGIVFVGSYTWQPNREAMAFFCAEILPLLRARLHTTVTWVGRAPDSVRRHYSRRHDVLLTGYVADIRPIVQRAACYVVPLRSGGGTRLKILDAWAMQKAVVSTSMGCEGLDARDGANILIRDDPAGFAAAVETVLGNAEIRSRIALEARATVERTYDWEVIGRAMLPLYRGAVGDEVMPL